MLIRDVQDWNALSPIEVTVVGMSMVVRPVLWKVQLLNESRELGSTTLARAVHSSNVPLPIVTTLVGMLMLNRAVHV
jgi:hypothetical protein